MTSILARNIRLASPLTSANGTAQIDFTNLPVNILEAFLPGYSVLSRFLLDAFGFDASLFVSVMITILGLGTTVGYIYRKFWSQIESHFTASVVIDSSDDIYDYMMIWISDHRVSKVTRSLKARDGRGSAWDDRDDLASLDSVFDDIQEDFLINLSNWEAKVPPQYEPYHTSRWFWHNGHFFRFRRERHSVLENRFLNRTFREDEQVTITVLGRSPEPIKEMIIEARGAYLSKQSKKTTVRRPTPKVHRNGGRASQWTKVAVRPSRPIETVVLNSAEKRKLLADINEYLHPATRRWYANRGIPYRRGYLFHGPPGSGKTSLSFAIAGIFGIDIFSLSLLDPGLTEEDLGLLFSTLPRHCVVLLEDIDSAGLMRNEEMPPTADPRNEESDDTEDNSSKPRKTKAGGKSSFGRSRPSSAPAESGEEVNRGISLSGLLNAIDGVASHEGRVLVMTTNHPDKLDPALIRPGRVDMMIGFTLATREQIKELFLRMYSDTKFQPGSRAAKTQVQPSHAAAAAPNGVDEKRKESDSSTNGIPVDLEWLASAFAHALPDCTLSPAEIQGYLLTRKKEPERALQEVVAWRDEIMKAKKAQSNGGSIFSSECES